MFDLRWTALLLDVAALALLGLRWTALLLDGVMFVLPGLWVAAFFWVTVVGVQVGVVLNPLAVVSEFICCCRSRMITWRAFTSISFVRSLEASARFSFFKGTNSGISFCGAVMWRGRGIGVSSMFGFGTVDFSSMSSFGASLDGAPSVGPLLVLRRLGPLGVWLIAFVVKS